MTNYYRLKARSLIFYFSGENYSKFTPYVFSLNVKI